MTIFVEQVEACLSQFDAIPFVQSEQVICSTIIAKISEKRKALTDPFLSNEELMNDLGLLLESLRDIANHDDSFHRPSSSVERQAVALSLSGQQQPPPGCKNGKHNPDATHPESKCWALHPNQQPLLHPCNISNSPQSAP